MSNFCPEAWTNPFGKMEILRPICIDVFIVQKSYYSIQNVTKQFFLAQFALKEKFKKELIFNQIHRLTPLEKCKFCDRFILMFLQSRRAIIISRRSLNRLFRHILPQKQKFKKGLVFNQIHGLAPLEKCKFCDLFIFLFLLSRKAITLSRTSLNSFSRPILTKKKSWRLFCFDVFREGRETQSMVAVKNHGLTPLEKCEFCDLLY